MKLSRRCFLSFVVGGAAGTALSPLPWKLMDDVSIWSQNWPWTPVPPEGQSSYSSSTCTLCPGGCGLSVRKIDDRAIKIEGIKDHPINDGGVCILGLSGLQLLYGPTRIQAPLKRAGKRGQGQWTPISWEQAVAEVAAKLGELRTQGRPQALACIAPRDTGTVPQLLSRFMTAFGSPNFFRMPSIADAYESALYLTQGVVGSVGVDVAHADFILSFGSGILDGYGSPVHMFQAHSRLKEARGTLVQIEPRLSNTAAKADAWLAIKPGSEVDLALAMAHVIIARQAMNKSFVADSVEGFEAFARMVQERYAPEKAAAKTGIDAAVIVETALKFAAAEKPLALYGKGKGQIPGSLKEALAVHLLNALVGNINKPGGVQAVAAYDYINWLDVETDAVAAAGLQTARLDGAGTDKFPHARYLLNRLAEAADGIQALLVAEANPCHSLSGCKAVQAAFDKIPFVVSFSSFMDETAMQADLILPNHTYLERYEDIPVSGAGLTQAVVGLCRPVVAPLYQTRHLGDTILHIAKTLKGSVANSFPWPDYLTCLKTTLGDRWSALVAQGVWVDTQKSLQGFETASGKFVMMNDTLGAIFLADDVAIGGKEAGAYPLALIPYDSIRLASRYVGDTPFMVKTVSDAVIKHQDGFVDINPETAQHLGLADGQMVELTTAVGTGRVRVHYDHRVMPGVIAMPRGLGHTAYDQYLAGKGVNVNQLIGPVEDPASGLDAAWGIGAKLA
jgi:anaerobic selenocysteine-containing dehydrogenase